MSEPERVRLLAALHRAYEAVESDPTHPANRALSEAIDLISEASQRTRREVLDLLREARRDLDAMERVEAGDSRWTCPECRSPKVQISLPSWHVETSDGHLVFVEADAEAAPRYWYCEDCSESGNGEPTLTA